MSDHTPDSGSTSVLPTATPPTTTSSILGASSSGWSPLRTTKRGSTVSYSQTSPEQTNNQHPSLHSPKKATQNFKSLRGHGLVSNSPFKQIDGGSQPNSPVGSAFRRQPTSPSVGLGIGVSNSPRAIRDSLKTQESPVVVEDAENSNPFNLFATSPTTKSPQRKIPRKSLGRLHESNYVSNSVFRQPNGHAYEAASPSSPLARTSAQPTSQASPASATKGLLVSNRLHGPRFMTGSPQSSHVEPGSRSEVASPLRQERRKTVTFDEILDVQEFDKESSFDAESFGDVDEQELASQDVDFWMRENQTQELKVANRASTDDVGELLSGESEPDLSHDSHETSSIEGPPSPTPGDASLQLQDLSVDHDLSIHEPCSENPAFESGRDISLARLSAADRVDSMMDELLRDDILNSPTVRTRQVESSTHHIPEPLSAQVETHTPSSATDQSELPQLPVWSPISLDVEVPTSFLGDFSRSRTQPEIAPAPAPIPPPTSRNGSIRGRPHISRDAILQRVAQAKAQADSVQSQQDARTAEDVSTTDSSTVKRNGSQQKRMPRGSEPGMSMPFAHDAAAASPVRPAAASRPSAPLRLMPTEPIATEVKPIPPPSPVKELEKLESPLDLLGTEFKGTADNREPMVQDAQVKQEADEIPALELNTNDSEHDSGLFSGMLQDSAPQAQQEVPKLTHLTPEQQAEQIIARRRSKNGKARRKRSMSTSDTREVFTAAANDTADADSASLSLASDTTSEAREEQVELPTRQSISADLAKSKAMLDVSLQRAIDGGFQNNMEKELTRIYQKVESNYNVNDRGAFQGFDDKVTHSAAAGDVDSGKAWKKLRRPSDINEYKKEMREWREGSNSRKAAGKVFVLVDSFTPTDLPVPSRPTSFHCILDNGLHMVKTATVPLRPGRCTVSKIAQEFELIQHKNLEFSLTLVVQRDAHLTEPQRPSSPLRREHGSPTLKGLSRLFSSPKKQAAKREQQEREAAAELAAQASRAEPMLAYINREGAFGRTGVIFERVASQCYARCMVLDLPVHGVSNPTGSISGPSSIASRHHVSMVSQDFRQNLSKVRGTLRLKLFYLPPLPSIPRDGLPENLGECIRGMQNAAWHKAEPWQKGTLTQLGGDCASWRRRPVEAQGQYLICYNAVTKKPTVKIDLSKAVCIEELGNHVNVGSMIFPSGMGRSRTMASYATTATLAEDEDADANYHVDRSFRITFADGERITFFADTEREKGKWVQVISDVIGSEVPSNPLWAQALLESIGTRAVESVRKPSQQFTQSRKQVPTVQEEEAPTTPKQAAPASEAPSTPGRGSSISNFKRISQSGGTPSRLPMKTPLAPSTPTGSVRGSPLPARPTSMIRTPVHDASNRAAFDRLKRAGHARAQTEDLTPLRRR